MFTGKVTAGIKLLSVSGFYLKPGEIVSLRVVKKLFNNKWAVSIGGKLLIAYTDIDLKPGTIIKAKVVIEENHIILKLNQIAEDAADIVISKYGLESDELNHTIVMSLLRAGVAIKEEYITLIRNLIRNRNKAGKKLSRLLAVMLDKGILLKYLDMEEIMPLIFEDSFGRRQKEDRKRRENQSSEKREYSLKKYIKRRITAVDNNNTNLLQLFNHLNAVNDNWIAVPFGIEYDNTRVSGTIRINIDSYKKSVKKIVIQSSIDGIHLSFIAHRKNPGYFLSVFCDSDSFKKHIKYELGNLKTKLQNLGVIIDDTILYDDYCDGFSSIRHDPVYKPVDTLG